MKKEDNAIRKLGEVARVPPYNAAIRSLCIILLIAPRLCGWSSLFTGRFPIGITEIAFRRRELIIQSSPTSFHQLKPPIFGGGDKTDVTKVHFGMLLLELLEHLQLLPLLACRLAHGLSHECQRQDLLNPQRHGADFLLIIKLLQMSAWHHEERSPGVIRASEGEDKRLGEERMSKRTKPERWKGKTSGDTEVEQSKGRSDKSQDVTSGKA